MGLTGSAPASGMAPILHGILPRPRSSSLHPHTLHPGTDVLSFAALLPTDAKPTGLLLGLSAEESGSLKGILFFNPIPGHLS